MMFFLIAWHDCDLQHCPAHFNLAYSWLQEKERRQLEEVDAARDEATAAAEAFSVVRRDRQDAFCTAFEHVAGVIDGIFKGGKGALGFSFSAYIPVASSFL